MLLELWLELQLAVNISQYNLMYRNDCTLDWVQEFALLCDVSHIHDNSDDLHYRIFKKRKGQCKYYPLPSIRRKEEIIELIGIKASKEQR